MEYSKEDYARLYGEQPVARGLFRVELLILAAVAAAIGAGLLFRDADSAEVTAKIEREVFEKKSDLPPLSLPIQYDATVTQCDTKDGCRTRLYVRSNPTTTHEER